MGKREEPLWYNISQLELQYKGYKQPVKKIPKWKKSCLTEDNFGKTLWQKKHREQEPCQLFSHHVSTTHMIVHWTQNSLDTDLLIEQIFVMDLERWKGHSTLRETCKQWTKGENKAYSKNKE